MSTAEERAKKAAYMRQYYRTHPPTPEWREKRNKYLRARKAKIRSTPEGREKLREEYRKWYKGKGKGYHAEWRKRNPDKVKAAEKRFSGSEKQKAAKRRYLQSEHGRMKTNENHRAYRKTTSGKRVYFASDLRKNYGLTIAQYEQMLKDQNGVCAICRKFRTTGKASRLAVDHDHTNGKNRGLLCIFCNNAIGFLLDDPATIFRAAQYVMDWQLENKPLRSNVETG